VVNRVSPAPAYAALKIDQLADQRLVIEKVCSPTVDEREHARIKLGFRPGAGLILDFISRERLPWPFAGIPISNDLGHAYALNVSANSRQTASGLNGDSRSQRQSRTTMPPSRCAIAIVMASVAPPEGSLKPT
jgi:hypothetical protein